MSAGPQSTSHVEALKSSSIIGGSTAITLLIRMVRTKVLAVLLGPAGVGLEAVYDSIVSVTRTLFEVGVSGSGVRQIAAAVGSGNPEAIARTVATLRRVCVFLALAGACTLYLVREPVSRFAFGSPDQSWAVGLLSVMLLFGVLNSGYGALLQGTRRIGDLARMNILGTLLGAVVTIPIVWVWGQRGIPAYMVVGGALGALVCWFYVRRIPIPPLPITWGAVLREAGGLLRLGLAFLASALMATGALFLLRIMVTRYEGVAGAGQFQAASALSLVYVGFILQAMGTDFYPRLTAVAADNARCNQVVNEQAEVSLVLGLPGILGTLACAPWVIHVFYSRQFDVATEILAWQMAGMVLRLISWPMGFILLAKGRGALFVVTDLVAWCLYLGLAWVGLRVCGLPGTGMAFLGLYAVHVGMIYLVARHVSGFRWAAGTFRLTVLGVVAVAVALAGRLLLPEPWATGLGSLITVLAGLYCLRTLVRLVGWERIDRQAGRFGLRVPGVLRGLSAAKT